MNISKDFFQQSLSERDPAIAECVAQELNRQQQQIELIASENIVSRAVLEAQGSILTNKYAEGYPGKRYYGGCEFVDKAETLAIERAKQLFGAAYVNVQPHSGSQANQAVFLATLAPGDTYLAMSLSAGGHLTHGAAPNMSGKWFKPIHYGVKESDQLIDYDMMEALALEHKPKLIIAGASAYTRIIDFARFRKVADQVGAKFMVDMAHYSGLIASGIYPSPISLADVVTTTTHKTLRGPRGGMILSRDEELGKKLNSAIFPGLQGGPLEHVIAAKAVAFGEALRPEFKQYSQAVLDNARMLAEVLAERGAAIVSGGTDCHMVLVDLRPKGLKGNQTEEALEHVGLTCNKNSVPFDPEKPAITSGIRLGTPAGTTRGFGLEEFRQIGNLIGDVLDALQKGEQEFAATAAQIKHQVTALCARFPIY